MTFVLAFLGVVTMLVVVWLLRVVWSARRQRHQLVELISAIMSDALGAKHWRLCAEIAREDVDTWVGLLNMLALGKRLPEGVITALRDTTARAHSGEAPAHEALAAAIEGLPEVRWRDPLDELLGAHTVGARKHLNEVIGAELQKLR